MCMGLYSRKGNIMTLNYGDIIRAMLGNNPNPFMSLDIPNGIRNEYKNVKRKWDNWTMNNLPQAPGMQPIMFNQLDETDPATWKLLKLAGMY